MTENLQPAFRALADPHRREILHLLSRQEMSVAQVAERFDMTRPAVKKHLTILEQGALVRTERRGRETINMLNPQTLKSVSDWLAYFDRFWDEKLTNLQRAIEQGDHD